jgi:hypothetical protein
MFVTILAVMVASVVYAAAGIAPPPIAVDERSFVGTYLRVTTGVGGTVSETLEIKADKTILWTTSLGEKAPVVVTGIWNVRGEVLVVVLGTRDGVQLPAGTRVVFDRKGKKLKGRIYDRTQFGEGDLVFQRSDRS